MKEIECCVVRDLLPLYIDGACSEQTAKIVKAHLQSCDSCRKLCEEMTSDVCAALPKPEFESKEIFRNACRHLIGIVFALAMMISCFVINAGGAWYGGPAGIGQFITTAVYLIFWSVFSVLSRKYRPLVKVSFVISLLTFISSVNGLVWRLLESGGFIAAFISIFTAVPFYGLRLLLGWTGVYLAATVFSLCWLAYTGAQLRKWS